MSKSCLITHNINMYYFYYFQCYQTGLYYGGITNNVLNRQCKHQKQLTRNLKSDKKPWHLYQDKIQLIVLWSFETKSQACAYEKQWIINNYLNPLCLNCSVSNSEYNASSKNHKQLCETNNGDKSKIRYALEVNNPSLIHTFNSSIEAAKFTKILGRNIPTSCKNAKPLKSESGRWLFSDISEADLTHKFINLTQAEIKGSNNYSKGFILINKSTGEQSQAFYGVYEPQKQNYKIHPGHLSNCLLGNFKTVNGYLVNLII